MKRVYDFAAGHEPGTNQGLLSQLVVPRPIAMVSTRSPEGTGNLAPYSYYLPITGEPPLVGVTFGLRQIDGRMKDSYDNLMASGNFVINVCSPVFSDHIEDLAKEFPADHDEADLFGYTWADSVMVSSPSIAEAPAHLECIVHQTVPLGSERAKVVLVVAEVVCAVIDEELLESPDLDHPRIDLLKLAPIGRTGARTFMHTTPDAVYYQERIPYTPAS